MSRSSSSSPKTRERRRPTEIGWDTDDDDDLRRYERSRSRSRSPPEVSEDACEAKMSWRRRAMVTGSFKVMVPETGRLLEETEEFRGAAEAAEIPARYFRYPRGVRVPRGGPEEDGEDGYWTRRTRYSNVPAFPGSGERHHVLWLGGPATPPAAGGPDIKVDRMVKLYDGTSVQSYQVDGLSDGPASPRFALVDPRRTETEDGRVSFDANLFWTVALLFKHFGTCGVHSWDMEIADMARAFRMRGPPPPISPTPSPPLMTFPIPSPAPQLRPLAPFRPHRPPPPSAVGRGPGLPIPTVVAPPLPRPLRYPVGPPTSSVPQQAPPPRPRPRRRPQPLFPNTSLPPPPIANGAAAPATDREEEENPAAESEAEVGRRYTGCVVEWHGDRGYLSSTLIPARVLLSANDVTGGIAGLFSPVGISVNFELARGEAGREFQAVKAIAYV